MKKTIVAIISIILFLFAGILLIRPKKSDELVFWTLQMRDFSAYMQKIISEFETQNPNIKIKWVDVPFSEGEKRTLASILSDNPPDLINLNPDFSALLAEKGTLKEFLDDELDQFPQEIIDNLKINGKNYLIPWYATSAVTLYNKKYANELKINPPKNYNEFFEICTNFKPKTSKSLISMPLTDGDYSLKMLYKAGIDPVNGLNSAQADEFFNKLKTAYDKGCIPKESVSMNHREALEKFMAGESVFFEGGANFLNIIKENAPETFKNTDIMPQITNDGYNFSMMNFVIPLKSRKRDDSLKFALFLTNKTNQLELAKLTNILATNDNALKSKLYTKTASNNIFEKARIMSAKQLKNIQRSKYIPNRKDVVLKINNRIQEILLN